ncbi:hypothetical protein [Mangrovivirga cuniculi]|uniref:Uncharacterized protein n=1 Tax=Mangrovivirga cuniculi TaxID=2715131 RepID=A0A4D7JVA1_9BACT|nr:hypothetical protein [Mangrovivirga cuniculi]QCK14765.1 hypothetical protein DCC35_08435 [Mangrovivirga cuniculi]
MLKSNYLISIIFLIFFNIGNAQNAEKPERTKLQKFLFGYTPGEYSPSGKDFLGFAFVFTPEFLLYANYEHIFAEKYGTNLFISPEAFSVGGHYYPFDFSPGKFNLYLGVNTGFNWEDDDQNSFFVYLPIGIGPYFRKSNLRLKSDLGPGYSAKTNSFHAMSTITFL